MANLLNTIGDALGITNSTGDAAAAAAQSATDAQNQLIQQGELPIYQEQLTNFNNNYQPLEQGTGTGYGNVLGAVTDPTNSAQIFQNFSNLLNGYGSPQGTDAVTGLPLQQLVDQNISYDANPGNMLGSAGNVGGQALSYDLNEAQNGLSPATMNAALLNNSASDQAQINTLMNQFGAGLPNASATLSNLNFNSDLSTGTLLGQLAGMNQQYQDAGMASALTTGQGIDSLTQNSLNNATQLASGESNQILSNMNAGNNLALGNLGSVGNYLTNGQSTLPGVASGINNLASQYGTAASGAATTAANSNAQQQANLNTTAKLFLGA